MTWIKERHRRQSRNYIKERHDVKNDIHMFLRMVVLEAYHAELNTGELHY